MWRCFATRKPEFQQGFQRLTKVKAPVGLPATKAFNRTENAEKLRSLMREQCFVPGVQLSESVKQFARRDEEFNTFLQDFKKNEEPKWRSIMDVKKTADFKDFAKEFDKTPQQRLDELHMHEQMRKRHIVQQYVKQVKPTDPDEDGDMPRQVEADFGLNVFNLMNAEDFTIQFLHVGTTTNVTKQQRVSSRRILMFMGNCEGMISLGYGKGWEYSAAYNDCMAQLKKNVVAIGYDPIHPCTRYLEHTHNRVTIKVFPVQSGMMKCNPTYANMLMMAGLRNSLMTVTGRSDHIYNVTKALYYALLRNVTPKYIAERMGQKVYEVTYGRSVKRNDLGIMHSL